MSMWWCAAALLSLVPFTDDREDAEPPDEQQHQESGPGMQLHREAAGRLGVHLHDPGQRVPMFHPLLSLSFSVSLSLFLCLSLSLTHITSLRTCFWHGQVKRRTFARSFCSVIIYSHGKND